MNKYQIDPFQEGYLARCDGQESNTNPYNLFEDVDCYFDWIDGYNNAIADEEVRDRRQIYFKERLTSCLYSMAFVAVCFIIGILLRYLME